MIAFAHDAGNIPENSCLLTFDDGYKDHIDYVLPELMKRKLQGSFFPLSEGCDRKRNAECKLRSFYTRLPPKSCDPRQ